MATTLITDPLAEAQDPDRVYYATGIMLGAEDFTAEQTYHRGRLARALLYLEGSGTVAGLKVEYRLPPAPAGAAPVEELVVHPGLAIDRLGRLIEVPREWCLRLDRWYREQAESSDPQPVSDLIAAYKGAPFEGVVADVFIRSVPCERGKTPGLAGPFDALEGVQPSRLRDGFEIDFILRREEDLTNILPLQNWPDLSGAADPAGRLALLKDAILNAWPADASTNPAVSASPEYAADQADKTSVFLARVVIKAAAPAAAGQAPQRPATPAQDSVTVDNQLRLFVYMPRALARVIGG